MLQLETAGDDVFLGSSPDYEWGRIYGGLVVAQALMAASATVPDDVHVHSLHAYFILGGDCRETVTYEVDRIRDGRSFTTRRVVAHQSAGAILNLSASFQRPEDGPDLQMPKAPEAPAPDDVVRSDWAAFMDYRETPREQGAGRSLAWCRYDEPIGSSAAEHAAGLAYLSDGNPMDAIAGNHPVRPDDGEWGSTFVSASLDHSIWFHRPVRADRWVLFDMTSQGLVGSRGVARGEAYQDGVLVATVVQEGLLRLRTR